MFALRQVGEHRERNTQLGKWYEFVGMASHRKEFVIAYKAAFDGKEPPTLEETSHESPLVFAFIQTPGVSYIPLYSEDRNYIMSESGKTFEKLNAH